MRNRIRSLVPTIVLACALLGSSIPDSYARSGSAYGPAVDTACLAFNGTTPFADQGCGLCHAGGNLGQRVEPQWTWWANGDLTAFCPPAVNRAPDGRIDAPATDQTITAGDSISFRGSGSDPDGDPISAYRWDFGGGAPASSVQNPGNVQFSAAGTFTVTLTVTDSRGLSDPTPDVRTITVVPVAPGNRPPDGTIDAPATDQSVTVGDSVTFAGSGSDPDGDPVTFFWNFGGGAPDATAQDPGSVRFNTPGSFTVTLTVTDDSGLSDPAPDSRIITVRPVAAACSDADGDGFAVEGGICGPEDCDDTNPDINPAATEVCADNLDNDCDLFIDDTDSECNGGDCIAELFGADEVPLTIEINAATWNQREQELKVEGFWPTLGALVTLTNALTGDPLGTTVVERDDGELQWEFERERLATVPCRVRVEIEGEFGERDVANAPADCIGSPTEPANQPPVANDDTAVTDEGVAVTIGVLANDSDPDGDPLTITTLSAPANGSVSTDGTSIRYAPASGFSGTDSFRYTVSDGEGGTASATVSVTVRAAPLPPAFEVDIEEASWNRGRRLLEVEGENAPAGSAVTLYNASTSALLATSTAESDGDWGFRLRSPAPVPCRVRVEIRSNGQVAVGERGVSQAPRDCR